MIYSFALGPMSGQLGSRLLEAISRCEGVIWEHAQQSFMRYPHEAGKVGSSVKVISGKIRGLWTVLRSGLEQ